MDISQQQTDQELLDNIAYLAGLASEIKAIDVELDTLRIVTASSSGNGFSKDERESLEQVVANLKDYLIHRDPLREFTADSLEQRMLSNKHATPRQSFKLSFMSALLISLIGAAPIAVLLGSTSLWDGILLAVPFFLLFTTMLNGWFYLSSMRNFKPELRQVFIYLCVGSIGLGLQFLHFVSITIFEQEQLPLYKYGGFTLIAALALVAIYIGLRRYLQLLSLKSRFKSINWLGTAIGLGAATAMLLVYILDVPEKGYLGFSLTSLFTLSIVALWSAGLAWVIMRNVTTAYATSMRRLFVFTLGVSVGALVYVALLISSGELSGRTLNAALALCALPPMLLLLHSGASFKRETNR